MNTDESRAALDPAVLTIWVVVNLVNVLQAIGFVSRVDGFGAQRAVGLMIVALLIPAGLALVRFVKERAGWRLVAGPAAFAAFVAFMIVIEYVFDVEFRSPSKPAILVPFVGLFFGSIVLMGAPMYRINQRLWRVTALTAAVLLAAMIFAMSRGVG